MLQERLLETAIDQFGRLGFEGASTRDIAQASGTAMSSITYHFGGKQGLYLAAADHIAKCLSERHKPALEGLGGDASGDSAITGAQAIERLLFMLDTLADTMLHPDSESWARFIVREQQEPTEAFERLYSGAMHTLLEGALRLMAIVRPDMSPHELRAQAALFLGMALVMRTARASVTRILGVEAIGADEAALLHAQLRKSALSILKEPSA